MKNRRRSKNTIQTILSAFAKSSVVLVAMLHLSGYGQATFADLRKKYPDYNETVLNDSKHYDFSIKDHKLRVTQDVHYESMILSENGIQNDQESFTYSELVQLKNYNAYSLIGADGHEKKVKVTQTNVNPYHSADVFHNEIKERQLIFPNLESGAKKIYDYEIEFTDPYLLHKFIFGQGLPVENATLEIKADKGIDIGYKVFNDPDHLIIFSQIEKKGRILYTWTMANIKPIRFEDNSPGFLHQLPHIDVYIKKYTLDNKEVPVLENAAGLYNYYKGFISQINKADNASLKTLSLDLVKDKANDTDKLRSILYWVKDHIRYIAFENGYEGFIPRDAGTVYERRFGDCKDMASIIISMASYAGIPNVTFGWIGTREIPYSYNDLATPSVDNHMIAVYKGPDKYYFLDATDPYTKFGMPTQFIQGKQAMIADGDSFKIIDVPVVRPEDNLVTDEAEVHIENEKLLGTDMLTMLGYNRTSITGILSDKTGKERDEAMKDVLLKGNNKFKLKSFSEQNASDRDLPYIIKSDFEIDNYLTKVGREIYVSLCMDKRIGDLMTEDDRQWKYDLRFLVASTSSYALAIPSGYKVKYMPEPFEIDNELFYCKAIYRNEGAKVRVVIDLRGKKILLERPDFKLWNETVRKMQTYFNESLILTQK